jgi:hypothetical protein
MSLIKVQNLTRDFEYYEKEAGFKGSVKNLFKRKKYIRHAVSNVSFSVEAGEIVGFIGPNGAGKTTTLKMLSGILHPTSGTAMINGYIPWERKEGFKRSFALVAGQKSQLWTDLPAIESLNLNKCIYEIPDEQYKATVNELTEMLDVKEFLLLFIPVLALATILNFYLFFLVSISAFWLIEVGRFFHTIQIVVMVISGGVFPITVLGNTFVSIVKLLPFTYTIYFPISVVTGALNSHDIFIGMLIQIIWIFVLYLLTKQLWRMGIKKYVAVGG